MAILDQTGGLLVLPTAGPAGPAIEGPPGPASTVPGPRGATGKEGPAGSPTTQVYQQVSDTDYQAKATDGQIGYSALTAARTVTLPDVDVYPLQQVLFIADETGDCSPGTPIVIQVGSGTGDTIAGETAIQITDAYQGIGLRRGAANVWIIAR